MKKAISIFGIVILAVLILFSLRFIVGGSEDDWICVDNGWVKHGMPSAPMPTEPCGEEQAIDGKEQLIGGEKDEHGCVLMAGYTWCEAKQKCLREWEEPCEQEEIFSLLTELKDSTKIKFSGIQDAEFKWIVRIDPKIAEETVAGKGFDVERISSEQFDSIHPFFIDNGFETDVYNFADGTISGLKGYKKDNTACVVAGGLTGYKEAEGQWIPPESDKWDVTVKCGKLEKTGMEYATEDWKIYTNEKYGYSLKYPEPCLYSPLPGYCKQSPPEERPQECRCFLNPTDPDSVMMQVFTGTKSDLNMASMSIARSPNKDYNPPAGADLIEWLKGRYEYLDIPSEYNFEIDGVQAVKAYTPQSRGAGSAENIFFMHNGEMLQIYLIDVDIKDNRAFYDKIFFTFKISEVSEEEVALEGSKDCAKDGETFSRESDKYLDSCCEGLKEWTPIPDTRFSIADKCYEIGPPSESNIGLCIKCGDGVCENHPTYDENPCNCPEDCAGKNKSHFSSNEKFCQSNDWKMSLAKACEGETFKGFPICEVCAFF